MEKLSEAQRQTLKGLIDAALPTCAWRKRFYDIANVNLHDAADWLRNVHEANQDTVTLIVRFLEKHCDSFC